MKKLFLALIVIALAAAWGAGVVFRIKAERKSVALARRVHWQIVQESVIRVFREHDAALKRWTSPAAGPGDQEALNRLNFYQALNRIDTADCPDDFTTAWMAYVGTWNPQDHTRPAQVVAHSSGVAGAAFGGGLAQKEQENTAFEACQTIAVKYGVRFDSH